MPSQGCRKGIAEPEEPGPWILKDSGVPRVGRNSSRRVEGALNRGWKGYGLSRLPAPYTNSVYIQIKEISIQQN